MNRLVIIGNGFDLAHGLPTGYCDFIDWYWRDWINNIRLFDRANYTPKKYSDTLVEINLAFKIHHFNQMLEIESEFQLLNNYDTILSFIEKYSKNKDIGPWEFRRNDCSVDFFNSFFKLINDKRSIQNWVDIENEYYKLLKDCLIEEDNAKVKKLNQEFEQVKNLLEKYLTSEINQKVDFDVPNDEVRQALNIFETKPLRLDLVDSKRSNYLKEFDNKDVVELIEFDTHLTDLNERGLLADTLKAGKINQTNLFLNFNYTKTVQAYLSLIESKKYFGTSYEIPIHGQLQNPENKINFGFGDEMDDEYIRLEKKEDNEYLKNIKSFQYLQNSNYKDMLDFIDSEKFQVYIMGHSCGLSDRILLNTIFEHENCRSIKVFYYEKDGWDNYTDIVQNISRHFNKKKMMRDKIVNKSLCQPLPQNVRFAKK